MNIATNRWGLNKKIRVGPVAMWIRECAPKTIDDWERYYMERLAKFLEKKGINLRPEEYIMNLGQKLYVKISEVLSSEINNVTESDCIEYIKNLIIKRTFDGYLNEIKTIYGYLESELGIKIHPASDEWDRLYNVDFYIPLRDKIIGLQIKPITYEQLPEVHKWKEWLERTHEKFRKEQNGEVFIIFTTAEGGKKVIHNSEVIQKIKTLIMSYR